MKKTLFPLLLLPFAALAQNPVISTVYTPDPAPYVHDGKVYLFTDHDEDDATYFKMKDWLVFSSEDMVNWTDCGSVASTRDFAWRSRENGAWALQVVERNGKFYMYCPLHGHGIGVLVADCPEGPWFYKRDGHYYLAFASTCCPEGIGYAMSDSPLGPWEYKGHIMDHTQRTRGNHPGIIDYKGKSYVFGLNYDIMHLDTYVHHERRSVSAAEMHYNDDGTIQEVPYFMDAVLEQVGTFNPFRKVEAETMAWGYGLKTDKIQGKGIVVTDMDEGEYIEVKGVDFKKGASTFTATLAASGAGNIEIHLGSTDGPLAGTVKVTPTEGTYKDFSCHVKGASGIHDLFIVFKGDCRFKFDFWRFR